MPQLSRKAEDCSWLHWRPKPCSWPKPPSFPNRMPRKPHFEVLVFRTTVWLSVAYDVHAGTLTPKGGDPKAMRNRDLPTPILVADLG